MLTLEEAKSTARCRICENIIAVANVVPREWKNIFPELITRKGERIVLKRGAEFAHYDCLNKCSVCKCELLPKGIEFNEMNETLHNVIVNAAVNAHIGCVNLEENPIDIIQNVGVMKRFLEPLDNDISVFIADGKGTIVPVFQIELINGVKRLIIKR